MSSDRMTRPQAPRPASMLDVARLAGVSGQTVSRVTNGSEAVAADTRERVLAAMRTLGYRPNSAARALKSGRFQSIGVLMFSLENFGPVHVLEGVSNAATARDYSLDLVTIGDPSTGEITKALERLDQERVDGIVIVLEAHQILEHAIRFPTRIPSILVDSQQYDDRVSVNADQAQGAELAVRHLLELGHPTVWHVSGPVHRMNAASDRQLAWRRLLEAEGRPVPPPVLGDWSAESGYRAGLRLARDPSVTAVFAANDQMALGLMRALHECGRRVPDEVSVVGFDDSPDAAYYWPPLTTVREDFRAVGALAIELLLEAIDGERHEPGLRALPNTLIVRDSTAPYR
ncbi:LacI family DNA-binding transcriptional regulator [Gryllotalpicola ginsengisoli]|uniref:LacI family DNA-binding transcriptional regulator n=1 Tax=Gryllotalpicola ginsengisoli TaxID=444608 RepID=UPI000429B58D|nr:LacI family DNA-binding transcriptional regulator [Gryllotalpicola ginsengisoli]